MLGDAIVKAVLSVCLSVRPSVHHARELHLNGSRYLNTFYTVQQSSVSGFLVKFS